MLLKCDKVELVEVFKVNLNVSNLNKEKLLFLFNVQFVSQCNRLLKQCKSITKINIQNKISNTIRVIDYSNLFLQLYIHTF